MPAAGTLVLGLHSATPRGGVALVAAGQVIAEIGFEAGNAPARRLVPSARFALEALGLRLEQLTGIGVSVGPGSFTGIRVGLATARGLAMSTGCPVTGVSSLRCLADEAGGLATGVAAWIDAGRGEVYTALFRRLNTGDLDLEGVEGLASPESALVALPREPLHFVGSGAVRYAERIARRALGDTVEPRLGFLAGSVARLAALDLDRGRSVPPAPVYLRSPDALRGQG